MTHPTTEPTQSIRERLAIAISPWERRLPDDVRKMYLGRVDAILSELMEPSEGMIESGERSTCGAADIQMAPIEMTIWKAMIQHIRDGGK